MTTSNLAAPPLRARDIHVSIADDGGWVVRIDRDGRTIATECYTDWHRVERRIAILKQAIGSEPDAAAA